MRYHLAALALVLCASAAPAVQAQDAEVIHWWTSEGESLAVKQMANAFDAAGGHWVDDAVAGSSAARQASMTRIVAGDPPAASQFNTGKDFEDLISQGLLRDITDVAKAGNWEATVPAALLEASERDGKVYAMPLNIHGRNWIWYNAAVLEEAGATPPTGWGEDMFDALEKVKAIGKVPLAFSGVKVFETMAFDSVLIDVGGADLWYALYRDESEEAFSSPTLRKAFETFARLRSYVDAGSPGRVWNEATNMVITGEAGFVEMGDWAKAEFTAAHSVPGNDIGCILPNGMLQIGGDVFVFPKQSDEAKAAAQGLLIETLADAKTLRAFNAVKGSIPPRSDIDMSGTDICAEKGVAALKSADTNVPRLSMLQPATVDGEVQDLISEFWNNPSMSADEAMKRLAEIVLYD